MKKYIELDNNYIFCFMEDEWIKISHPLSDYYLKIDDLSINLLINLKWIKWGFFFLKSISENLERKNINFEDFIQKGIGEIKEIKYDKHILIIDGMETWDLKDMIENFYSDKLFDENTKIHLKLKINLRDYLIISNLLFPTLIKIK